MKYAFIEAHRPQFSIRAMCRILLVHPSGLSAWLKAPKSKRAAGDQRQTKLIHCEQALQFTSMEWASFPKQHDLVPSMSRRGNVQDNAVAESFINLLKRERIRRRTYRTRKDARRDVFDYIDMFYNPKRKRAGNGMLSPAEFEKQQKVNKEGV